MQIRLIRLFRVRSGSVNSAASCQSFGSAASVFSVEDGDRAAFVGGQYHTPVSQEPAVDLAQQCETGQKK